MEINYKKIGFFAAIATGIILVGTYLTREWKKLENSCYTIAGGIIHSLGLNNVKITLFFKIKNTSDLTIKLSNMFFNVYVNGMFITTITKKETQKLTSRSESIFKLDFQFNPQDLLKAGIKNIEPLLTSQDKLIITVKGAYNADAGIVALKKFPFEESITLKELLTPSPNPKKC